jgi:hypothetical protein
MDKFTSFETKRREGSGKYQALSKLGELYLLQNSEMTKSRNQKEQK